MNNKKLIINILLTLSLSTLPSFASPIPSYDMEEIIVTANADRQSFAQETINTKIVSPGKATTIPELLQQTVGIDIQRRTLTGDNQDGTVKLRGFDARRFTLLIDGRPVAMSGVMNGNRFDWNTIPLDMVDKIQIIKGAKAAAYGNTLGGVVNIITKQPTADSGNLRLLAGEYGQYQYLFNYAGTTGQLGWSIFANKYGADAFLRNNDYDSDQYGFRINYDATAKDSLQVAWNHIYAKRGMIIRNDEGVSTDEKYKYDYDPRYPTINTTDGEKFVGNVIPNPGAFWEKDNTNYDFTWKHKTTTGFAALTYWNNEEKRREVNYSLLGVLNLDRTIIADNSTGWQLTGEETRDKHLYRYGADYKRYRYGYGWYDVGTGMDLYPSQKVNLFGLYLDDTWQLTDRWTGNIGLRYDKMAGRPDANPDIRSSDYDGLAPKLNFTFRNNDQTKTFVAVNRLWRAPSMPEFYWWSTNYSSANPNVVGAGLDLKPEKGWNYEIGIEKQISPQYSSKLTTYYQDIKDYINFTHQYPYSCYNISQAIIWGFEWENTYKLSNSSKLILNYTNQHTRKKGVNAIDHLGLADELDYRPEHKATLSYYYDQKPWQIRYNINFVGRQKANYPYGSNSTVEIGSYTVHDLSVIRNYNDSSISLTIHNLFDKKYVEQYNYPMLGRIFSISYNHKL